jgi:ketosteroid isomerase-like protein
MSKAETAIPTTAHQVVQMMYDCANSGDTEAMLDLWADDITLIEAEGHPFPGVFHGKAEVLSATPGVIRGINMIKTDPIEWIGNGNRVAVLIKITSRDKDGCPFSYDCLELWTVNETGKICEIRPFYHDLIELRQRLGLD